MVIKDMRNRAIHYFCDCLVGDIFDFNSEICVKTSSTCVFSFSHKTHYYVDPAAEITPVEAELVIK